MIEAKLYKIISWIYDFIEEMKKMDSSSIIIALFVISWFIFMFMFEKVPFNAS
jgi:hypothetical protein|tara:strand:- start:439 stop:597 length:159 start_codon:yes stop_codon:yes gene_type:complete